MYSWRIHLVLFIVQPTQHKELSSLSLLQKKYLSVIQYFVSFLIIRVSCWRCVNIHIIMSVCDSAMQIPFCVCVYTYIYMKFSFFMYIYTHSVGIKKNSCSSPTFFPTRILYKLKRSYTNA